MTVRASGAFRLGCAVPHRPPIPEAPDVTRLVALVRTHGYGLLRAAHARPIDEIIKPLGEPLDVVELTTPDTDRSDATVRASYPHTDDLWARHIVWVCKSPAKRGGEPVLVDGTLALERLKPAQRDLLTKIHLGELGERASEDQRHPLLTRHPDGRTSIYYAHWRADHEDMPAAQRTAFEAFSDALYRTKEYSADLDAGDVLVWDNHRILHGSMAIKKGTRQLTRYWLGERRL